MLVPDRLVDAWLEEDAPCGDLTTEILDIGDCRALMRFYTRAQTVVCGTEEVRRRLARQGVDVQQSTRSGEHVRSGAIVLEA